MERGCPPDCRVYRSEFSAHAILFLPILFGMESLYHWVDKETVAQDALLQTKEPYLNVPFFLIRMVIYFGTGASSVISC